MDQQSKPSLGGFLILLCRVLLALVYLLICVGAVLFIPFAIAFIFVCMYSLAAAVAFDWTYVWGWTFFVAVLFWAMLHK